MHEVVRHLEAMIDRGCPVLAGTVEQVIEARRWGDWQAWVGWFHKHGYRTKLIALNSMHVSPVDMPRAPQSRDRLWFVFWLARIGRDPDFDRWLRPRSWCPVCEEWVQAIRSSRTRGRTWAGTAQRPVLVPLPTPLVPQRDRGSGGDASVGRD